MNTKQLLARVFVETAPWHTVDGWFCEQCESECGASMDTICRCCEAAVGAVALSEAAGGGS